MCSQRCRRSWSAVATRQSILSHQPLHNLYSDLQKELCCSRCNSSLRKKVYYLSFSPSPSLPLSLPLSPSFSSSPSRSTSPFSSPPPSLSLPLPLSPSLTLSLSPSVLLSPYLKTGLSSHSLLETENSAHSQYVTSEEVHTSQHAIIEQRGGGGGGGGGRFGQRKSGRGNTS